MERLKQEAQAAFSPAVPLSLKRIAVCLEAAWTSLGLQTCQQSKHSAERPSPRCERYVTEILSQLYPIQYLTDLVVS